MECTSDILVTYAKILNSRHVLIDKMVLEFLCCIGLLCNNNRQCERWTYPNCSEMSQLNAVHYSVCKDPGVIVHPETIYTLRFLVVILSVTRQRLRYYGVLSFIHGQSIWFVDYLCTIINS